MNILQSCTSFKYKTRTSRNLCISLDHVFVFAHFESLCIITISLNAGKNMALIVLNPHQLSVRVLPPRWGGSPTISQQGAEQLIYLFSIICLHNINKSPAILRQAKLNSILVWGSPL